MFKRLVGNHRRRCVFRVLSNLKNEGKKENEIAREYFQRRAREWEENDRKREQRERERGIHHVELEGKIYKVLRHENATGWTGNVGRTVLESVSSEDAGMKYEGDAHLADNGRHFYK